jgi:hypothetical protein
VGGFGSGRQGGRPTVGSGLSLDLNKLLRNGTVRRNTTTAGTISWSYSYSGEHVASMGYKATLGPERGHIRLQWTQTDCWTGEKQQREQWIELESRPQPLGGRRWWFVCPRRGDLVWKLHLPAGASTFASRRAYRLAYQSQRESPRDRAMSRAWKARSRVRGVGGIGDPYFKPKGMRWKTFNRLAARVDAAEEIVDDYTILLMAKLVKFGQH